eukprot:TRINITY_DN9542_c0_g1_i1.p1 TRINITY_DN9542_c0_g1~~TRINITY_DN9542_c0_g1_i1.p1  ORF type:complete len:604 (-),score=146.52 TRINITY_DN9542_c0_g1_i1:100-1674(-)
MEDLLLPENLPADVAALNAALSTLPKLIPLDTIATHLTTLRTNHGISPDSTTFAILLRRLALHEDLIIVSQIEKLMESQGVIFTEEVLRILISIYSAAGRKRSTGKYEHDLALICSDPIRREFLELLTTGRHNEYMSDIPKRLADSPPHLIPEDYARAIRAMPKLEESEKYIKQILDAVLSGHVKSDTMLSKELLEYYLGQNAKDQVDAILDTLLDQIKGDIGMINLLISFMSSNRSRQGIDKMERLIIDGHVLPNKATYRILASVLGNVGRSKRAEIYMEKHAKYGTHAETVEHDVSEFVANNNIERLLSILKEIPDVSIISPQLLDKVIVILQKDYDRDHKELLAKIRRKVLTPDYKASIGTLSMLLKETSSRREVDFILERFRKKKYLPVDAESYDHLFKFADPEGRARLFKMMESVGIVPDEATFLAAISSVEELALAQEIMKTMMDLGYNPTPLAFVSMLRCAENESSVNKIFRWIVRAGGKPIELIDKIKSVVMEDSEIGSLIWERLDKLKADQRTKK